MKTVIITGASRGIGKATAMCFAKAEYNVIINYNKSKQSANNLKMQLLQKGFSVDLFKADVSQINEAQELIEYTASRFGSIDVLVNNCGISHYGLFTDCSEYDFQSVINTNVFSAFNCTKFALPYMIKNHSGKIINISSIWGITGASCEVLYSTSKAAIIGFTKALAKEVAPSSINVNCVAPGVVDTDMIKDFSSDEIKELEKSIPVNRIAKPFEIAETILFLASEKADYITGQVISPNGGFVI